MNTVTVLFSFSYRKSLNQLSSELSRPREEELLGVADFEGDNLRRRVLLVRLLLRKLDHLLHEE